MERCVIWQIIYRLESAYVEGTMDIQSEFDFIKAAEKRYRNADSNENPGTAGS